MSFWVSLAAGLGLILSAETLVLAGNGVGRAGVWFLISAVIGACFHLAGAWRLFGDLSGPEGETGLLTRALGQPAAVILPLIARLPVTLVAATSLLVIAGYVFNEVFIYWFPNFLFAFMLLGLILAAGLAGGRIWSTLQIVAVAAAFGGLAVLIIAGIGSTPVPSTGAHQPVGAGTWLQASLGAVLLPMGYDLARLAQGQNPDKSLRSPAASVFLGVMILLLWGITSLRWVAPAALAETTIPYTVAARAILGQEGRIIMGIVILAGACAAVNALFGGVSHMLAGMSRAGLVPAALGTHRWGRRLPVLFLTVATAAMLAFGIAGSSHLKAYLQGALILWLLYYAVLHLAALAASRYDHSLNTGRIFHGVVGLVFVIWAFGLVVIHEQTLIVTAFMVIVGIAALLTGLLLNWLARPQKTGR